MGVLNRNLNATAAPTFSRIGAGSLKKTALALILALAISWRPPGRKDI